MAGIGVVEWPSMGAEMAEERVMQGWGVDEGAEMAGMGMEKKKQA